MIVLDTTVLVYASGGEHPLREPCGRILEAASDGVIEATTTVEVIQEFVHVRARRRDRADAVARGLELARMLRPLLPSRDADLLVGLRLYEEHPRLDAFDAVLAATAISAGAEALISADRAYASIRGLRHVDPATPALEELLSELRD